MRISPLGALVVVVGALVGIIMWVVGFIGLPNVDTHRDLAHNPKIETSAANQTANTTGPTTGSGTQPAAASTPWYSLASAANTLNLSITSALTSDASGFNFNGYNNGALKITVPKGWKVNVTFANKDASVPHSVGIVPYASRTTMTSSPAFPGALSPKFMQGIVANDAPLKFSFTASKPGQYAMICGVPGHDAGGMWDEFDVSATAKTPSITTPSGTVQVTK